MIALDLPRDLYYLSSVHLCVHESIVVWVIQLIGIRRLGNVIYLAFPPTISTPIERRELIELFAIF